MRIPTRLLRTLLLRGAALWILARLAGLATLAFAASQDGSGPPPAALVAGWSIAVSPLLVLADLHRRKEVMLLHNLGITTASVLLLEVVIATGLEVLLIAVRS